MRKLSSMTSLHLLLLIELLWVACGGCGVKGRPLPPEYPPYIGRGMIEESLHPDTSNPPLSEVSKETEDHKLEPQDSTTVPVSNSKDNTVKPKKNSSAKKNKEQKK